MIGTPGFNNERLIQAREARGLTAVALAQMIGVTSANVSQYERGKQTPSPDVMDRLAQVLNCPRSFFLKNLEPFDQTCIWYRSMSTATKMARVRVEARFQWLKEIVAYLKQFLELPSLNIPAFVLPTDATQITNDQIEEIATQCRVFWNLGDTPITDLLLVLENNGIVVAKGELATETLDSFSQWPTADSPYIFLNSEKASAVRLRFDAAHELGHLLLHRGIDGKQFRGASTNRLMENQCHRFALAFLLPAKRFTAELWAPTLNGFYTLKDRWRVSIQAMVKRCEQLGILDEIQLRRTWINLSRRGWRKWEPLDDALLPETPRLLPRSIDMLVASDIRTKEQILADLCLSAPDLEDLVCVPSGYFRDKPQLRLIPREKLDQEDNGKGGKLIEFGK